MPTGLWNTKFIANAHRQNPEPTIQDSWIAAVKSPVRNVFYETAGVDPIRLRPPEVRPFRALGYLTCIRANCSTMPRYRPTSPPDSPWYESSSISKQATEWVCDRVYSLTPATNGCWPRWSCRAESAMVEAGHISGKRHAVRGRVIGLYSCVRERTYLQ